MLLVDGNTDLLRYVTPKPNNNCELHKHTLNANTPIPEFHGGAKSVRPGRFSPYLTMKCKMQIQPPSFTQPLLTSMG